MAGDGNTDSDALEWARESLRRRREDLAKEREAMIGDAETTFHPDNGPSSRVGSLLQRGQALLAEAQVHSEILGRYVVAKEEEEEEESARDGGGGKDSNADDADEKEDAPEIAPSNEESTEEGARARLDQLIAQVRQQDDNPRAETPPRRIAAAFDPSALKSSTRAQFRRARLDEETAQAEEEMLRLSSFKALPMPDNTPVKNNPLASTKAFECRTASLKKLVGRDQDRHGQSRMNDAFSVASTFGSFDCAGSVATARTSLDESLLLSEYDNDEDRERARQVRAERVARKQHLLDKVNETIVMEGTEDDATTVCSQGGDYLEDPSTLRQQIARLQAKLKQTKTLREKTLNDIVDIDLDAPFDRLLTERSSQDARRIVGRLKEKVCGDLGSFRQPLVAMLVGHQAVASSDKPTRRSLFDRHESWAKHRDQKLEESRRRLEDETLQDVTGMPEVSRASRSWDLAKKAHDAALQKAAIDVDGKQAENKSEDKPAKDSREQAELKAKECEAETKRPVNRKEQMERLERLSKPRQTREKTTVVKTEADYAHLTELIDHEKPSPKSNPLQDRLKRPHVKTRTETLTEGEGPNEFAGTLFSDMSDREFAKLVKKVSAKAARKGKPEFALT